MKTHVNFTGRAVFSKVVELDALPQQGDPIRVRHPEDDTVHNGYVAKRAFEESVQGTLVVDGYDDDGDPRVVVRGTPEWICKLEVQEA